MLFWLFLSMDLGGGFHSASQKTRKHFYFILTGQLCIDQSQSSSANHKLIVHFRVAACLSFKASPGAQPFKWKWVAYSYSGTMIKFLPLDFLSVSHRIPWKNKNAIYRLQISLLVPEIFKFEKWVKYANEMTDDVIHSTQYYIEYINRATFANLQSGPLKLGSLIVLQETHLWL